MSRDFSTTECPVCLGTISYYVQLGTSMVGAKDAALLDHRRGGTCVEGITSTVDYLAKVASLSVAEADKIVTRVAQVMRS